MRKNQETSKKNKKIYQIQRLQQFKNIHTPNIQNQRKTKLAQTLQIDKEAQVKVQQRQKKDDYYVFYNRNPFTELIDKNANNVFKKDAKIQNLPIKVAQLSQKKIRTQYLDLNQQFKNTRNDKLILSKKIMQNMQKINYQKIYFKKETSKQINQKTVQKVEIKNNQDKFPKKLSDISKIKQQNIFLKKQQKYNVLKIAKKFNQQTQPSVKSFLQSYYFIQNSILQSYNMSKKLSIYRQLSSLSRSLLCNKKNKQNILDYLDGYQLSVNLKQINYSDMQNISSGRFNSNFIFNYIYQITQDQQNIENKTQVIEKDVVVLAQNTQTQKAIMTDEINIQKLQIQLLKSIQLQISEQQHKFELQKQIKKIQQQTKIKRRILEQGIDDKQVHKARSKIIQNQLNSFNINIINDSQFIRYVGHNKKSKTKQDLIKIQLLKKAVNLALENAKQQTKIKKQLDQLK